MFKNKIKYLLLLAGILLLSILYNKYRMGILFLTVFTMPIILLAVISYLYRKVTIRLLTTAHVVNKGEAIPISIELNNPTIFPISNLKIYLTYKNSFSEKVNKKEFNVPLDHKTITNVSVHLYSEYAGNLVLTLSGYRIYDYIRLFSLKKKMKEESKIAVLPNFYEIEDEYKQSYVKRAVESEYYSNIRSGDDPSEVFAIREYREGDRLTRIHWKLSQKQDKLMIKEFSDPINCAVLIFVDAGILSGADTLICTDAILECSLSLSRFFITNGQFHYISWYDKQHGVSPRLRITNEDEMFTAVAGLLQTTAFTSGTEALKNYHAEFINDMYTDFYYITGELCDSSLEAVSMMKATTKKIIYVGDLSIPSDVEIGRNKKIESLNGFRNKTEELGVGFLTVDIYNRKETLEHLTLSC